jgi:dipeptidyl aminopeptidase/acylaminoacyl peptidase
VAPDGTGLTQLTDGPGYDGWEACSPDGTKVAFAHNQGDQGAIYVMNADGTGLTSVFDQPGVNPGRPLWSPDGTRLIFEALVSVSPGTNGHPDYNYDIYVVSADGNGLVYLTPTTNRTENSPVWAPDGTKIAFESSNTLNGENSGTFDIFVMNPDGTGEQRLTTDQHADGFDLSWQAVPVGGATLKSTGTQAAIETPPEVHPHAVATIDVGQLGQVSSLLAAQGSIWVAGYETVGSGWVKRIDPATNEVVATVPLEAAPGWEVGGGGMAAGSGSIWVTGPGQGPGAVLQRIDPSTNQVVATIPLDGQEGADVTVDDSGVWVLVFDTSTSMKVLRVDPATNEAVATVPIDSDFSRKIAAADGAIWVEEHRSHDPIGNGSYLAKIDPSTNQVVATVPNGSFGAFDPVEDVIWTDTGYGLARIDPRTAQFIGDPAPVGSAIRGFGIIAGAGGVWFFGYDDTVDSAPSFLERFNPMTNEFDASLEFPNLGPIALALAPSSVWIVNLNGSVTRVDLS